MNIEHGLSLIGRGLALAGILCVTAACSGHTYAPPKIGPEVGVATLQPQDVMLTAEVPGSTSAFLTAEIRPHVGGIILQRLFEEGSDVEAGQLLYQIDPANYQAAFNRAKAALSRAEANQLAARLRAERSGNRVGEKAIGQDAAAADVAYKHAQAAVLAAHAALDAARINLAHTRVTAPISGRIHHSTVTSGALVTAGQPTPLATVLLLDPIYVDVTQSSAAVLRMKQELTSGKVQRPGAAREQVWLRLADGSEYAYSGKLELWEVSVDEGPSSVTLRAVFPNPDGQLRPGMSVRAQLQEGVRSQALLVPQRAVIHDAIGQARVFVLDTNNRVEIRPVTTERRVGDQWIISAGLKAGERIVVEGVQRVRPGITVTPAPSPSNAPKEARKSGALVAANRELRSMSLTRAGSLS